MNGLRVLQLGSSSGLYGAERWILALVNNLDTNKVTPIVGSICDLDTSEPPLCLSARQLDVRTNSFFCNKKFSFSLVKDVREFIKNNEIEIIHTHGYKTDLVGLLAVRGTNCKIITTPHGWTKKPDWKLFCYEVLDRMIFPFFDAVVPLSSELYDNLKWIPNVRNKIHLIANGVDTKEIETGGQIAPELSLLKKDGEFVIGYIGRLTSGKGLDVLIDAVATYGESNWRVAIVGEGEHEAELKEKVNQLGLNDVIHFFGFREDRLSFLAGFDVFCLPSRSEGIPRCLMESMAAKIPIVASDIAGCRYLVDGKDTGLLFRVDSDRDLATSLSKIQDDIELRKKLAQSAYEYVYKHYSANRMAKEYTDLFFSFDK